ncbi:MAG: hypothetical protein J1E95_12415, partial [Muribaculaceae bacterium]|nr:hypothetical protein [Muribaculaceae bacterium]
MKTILKVRSEQVFDPETGDYRWARKEYEKYLLEEEDRQQIVMDILQGKTRPEEVKEKYDLSSVQLIYGWIGKYISENEVLSLQEINEEEMARKSKDDQIKELKAQLKQARKELDYEKLRAHA